MLDSEDLKDQLQKALRECASLREENERLKKLLSLRLGDLAPTPIPIVSEPSAAYTSANQVTNDSPIETQNVIVLKGGMGSKQRKAMADQIKAVPDSKERVILSTGRYIGEGFDDARLDTLFLAMPISWRGTLQQYVGRLHRLHDNKQVVQVYDYVDIHVPTLMRMYKKRVKGYEAIGYSMQSGHENPVRQNSEYEYIQIDEV